MNNFNDKTDGDDILNEIFEQNLKGSNSLVKYLLHY